MSPAGEGGDHLIFLFFFFFFSGSKNTSMIFYYQLTVGERCVCVYVDKQMSPLPACPLAECPACARVPDVVATHVKIVSINI